MTSPSSLDGLPKTFVTAMRTLFDVMDDKGTGHVHFSEIENWWQDDGSKGIPKGFLESLRKVTPTNGLLTFERFCAGSKICLMRYQVEQRNQSPIKKDQNRPPSAPLLDIDTIPAKTTTWSSNTAAIRPNNVLTQQRTLSMPQLLPKEPQQIETSNIRNSDQIQKSVSKPTKPCNTLYGPPKPPRTLGISTTSGGNLDRAEIRNALQNWQMGVIMNDQENNKNDKRFGNARGGRSMGDGKAQNEVQVVTQNQGGIYQKKVNVRRREPRRHTLQNGIDYNMLKRMKQIEQEKDVLMQGLGAIEKAREWYLKQVAAVQEKMKYLGRMGTHVEHWSEAQQERLELQRARVLEVNRHLAALTDSWERGGLPLHMNLAVNHYFQPPHDLAGRLKQQNHLLTEEVGKKSEKIAILEREKASLIRELYQAKSNRSSGQEEVVF
ncbi:suppressor APC domain-containing protein 2 [Onthophagus taurus]|uniref:suppressor APC domain-containing protein 2 n=1 Tax=Onthophagus taurus TaxID=166361 RepID=UPI000C20F91A|nr:suppressor APC domain-containing protein 2 [Onthophagus taurus]